jgi:hypothetical protein
LFLAEESGAKAWERVEKRAISTIQPGERDEVNPWVERTQWLPYLVGIERADLLACIEEPVAEPDPRSEDEGEPVEAAICILVNERASARMGARSARSVVSVIEADCFGGEATWRGFFSVLVGGH